MRAGDGGIIWRTTYEPLYDLADLISLLRPFLLDSDYRQTLQSYSLGAQTGQPCGRPQHLDEELLCLPQQAIFTPLIRNSSLAQGLAGMLTDSYWILRTALSHHDTVIGKVAVAAHLLSIYLPSSQRIMYDIGM